jgi:hypothetical protein
VKHVDSEVSGIVNHAQGNFFVDIRAPPQLLLTTQGKFGSLTSADCRARIGSSGTERF